MKQPESVAYHLFQELVRDMLDQYDLSYDDIPLISEVVQDVLIEFFENETDMVMSRAYSYIQDDLSSGVS